MGIWGRGRNGCPSLGALRKLTTKKIVSLSKLTLVCTVTVHVLAGRPRVNVNASRPQPALGQPLYMYCSAETSGAVGVPQRLFWVTPPLANLRRGFIPSAWTAVLYVERFSDTEWGFHFHFLFTSTSTRTR